MKIIAGLGNPGPQYETTRHNVGFLAVDRLVERWNAGPMQKKNQSEIFQGSVDSEKLILVKPQTYMNLSGRAVAPLFQFYKCQPEDLVVIHDEIDLKPLQIRIKKGGGTAGHNGLRSLDQSLGAENKNYYRVRIGVGKPEGQNGPAVHDYVLQPFTNHELKLLDQVLDDVSEAVELILKGRVEEAMNRYHGKEPV